MPLQKKPQNPKSNLSWIQVTKDFVKEWPEILDEIKLSSMPIKYVLWVDIFLKNNVVIHIDVSKDLQTKSQNSVAKNLKDYINQNRINIKTVDIKFDVPKLKEDMESKTNKILSKAFRKN